MNKGTLLYAQSGGVTAVINATAGAVIEAARAKKIRVLAARNGILGALREDLVDTSKESPAAIRALAHTPGGAFGSCRYKLKSLEADRAQYERLIEVFKAHDIGYFFYTGPYVDAVTKVLDPALKTIVHIPNVNARESLKDKEREVNEIMSALGEWQGVDPATGFHLIKAKDGRTLKVADLVDDSDAARRSNVLNALKDPTQKNNRDHVDVIIALGMAKEGFDWIWCEHALTVGYRASLTEIVQIIGRATRDAPGKTRARFTNLIAEPDATEQAVTEAINDTLKAIAASLLMARFWARRWRPTTGIAA